MINTEKMLETLTMWVSTYSIKIVAAILVFIIGKWISKKLSKTLEVLLQKYQIETTLINFLKNMAYYTLLIMVIIAAAGQLGINTTSFLTIIGAAGLAVGLALKDSLSNFASGVMLILFHPFRQGDVITTAGATGKVTSIAIFSTTLTTPDNQRVIIPNSAITGNTITNITANPTRRVDLVVGIGYDDDISKVKQILTDLVQSDARVLKDPAPAIAVTELGDSSVNLAVRPWVNTGDYWGVLCDLTEKIKITFDQEGISIPFPQRELHVVHEKQHETT